MKNFNLIESGFLNIAGGVAGVLLTIGFRTNWLQHDTTALIDGFAIGTFLIAVLAAFAGVLIGEVIERIIPEKKRK